MTRILVVLFASLVVASCATVHTNIAVTHALPVMGAGKTVAIMPYTESLSAAPDFQANAAKLAAHLQQKGYTVVPSGGPAPDYLAFFLYRIDSGTPVNTIEGLGYPPTGSIITYGLRTTYSYSTHRVYMRAITVEIVDRARFRPNDSAAYMAARLYSGSVTSDGACSTMASVIGPMLTALFADFPGQSGGVRTVDIRADTACGGDRFD
jgi:hypothetical protein